MSRSRLLLLTLALLLLTALARLLLLAPLELAADEAYYLAWSRHPTTLTWLDHPPLIAWLLALAPTAADLPEALRPWAAAFVRLPALLCAALTALAVGLLSEGERGERGVVVVALALSLTPALGLGGLLATPDAPLLACWAWSAVALVRRWPSVLAVTVALGLLAKLPMLLFVPAALVGMWLADVEREERRRLTAAMAVGVALAAPIYALAVWRGDVVGFQAARHGGALAPSLLRPLELVGGALGLLTPLLGAAVGWVGLTGWRLEGRARLLWAVGALPLGVVLAGALVARVELNWLAVGWVTLTPLVAAEVGRRGRRAEGWVWGSAAALGVAAAVALGAVAWGVVAAESLGVAQVTRRVSGWRAWCDGLSAAYPQRDGVVWATSRYQEAAQCGFWTGRPVTTTRALSAWPGAPRVRDPARRPSAFEAIPVGEARRVVLVLDLGVAVEAAPGWREASRRRHAAPPARPGEVEVVVLER